MIKDAVVGDLLETIKRRLEMVPSPADRIDVIVALRRELLILNGGRSPSTSGLLAATYEPVTRATDDPR